MGQYFHTGIIVEFRIYKSEIPKISRNLDKVSGELAPAVVDNPNAFDLVDEGDYFAWKLKQDIIEKRLPLFLKRYFNDFCSGDSEYYDSHCKLILDYLSTNPSIDKLHEWDEDSDYVITLDKYEIEEIAIAKGEVQAHVYSILLTSEGKVMYEELDRHLEFFERAMRKAYADDPLGGCLMATIW